MAFTFKGRQYEEARKLTLGELSYCEDKFDKPFTDFKTGQQMLAMYFCSIKRTNRAITWEEIASSDLTEFDDVPELEPEPKPEVPEAEWPLDPTVGGTQTAPQPGSAPNPWMQETGSQTIDVSTPGI